MPISSLPSNDNRLAHFATLRDRDLRRECWIVAEGRWLSQRLIKAGLEETTVFLAPRFVEEFSAYAGTGVEILVAPEEVLSRIAGFPFHRGALAIARRPVAVPLDALLADGAPQQTVVALPDTTNAENLGAIFRSAAALGVRTVLLGPQCCDEFSRRALRVSMGAALKLQLIRSADILGDLARLRDAGFSLAATALAESAIDLAEFSPADKTLLLFGSEADGLSEDVLALADTLLTIPMAGGVDSLNLAAAAAITLWHVQHATISSKSGRYPGPKGTLG